MKIMHRYMAALARVVAIDVATDLCDFVFGTIVFATLVGFLSVDAVLLVVVVLGVFLSTVRAALNLVFFLVTAIFNPPKSE